MLSGLVLAGGKSSRMQQDKALLAFAGTSLLRRAEALLRQSGCEEVLVSRNQPGFLADIYPDAGPLGGIYSALMHQTIGSSLVVLPVDMPFASPELLQHLINAGQAQASACYLADCYLPMYLPVTQAARDFLQQLLSTQGQGRVKALLHHINAIALPCPADLAPQLRNLNTPAQWQQATGQSPQ
ncbi:molybdenum cofactor guanylyltransferase [Bowmanella sp. Y26]|uniref:molybdenum cofactor guanylyltransferase n=1 Tax=Bowmanella yangjiangensis TaxID=2811230 RepID=UPI001BDDAB92|nr:molybdenum cofactor guanylyltransferase [Bowmanella yangjiangensis]MBT1063735.1 molybdenum cofactor guanylyltransferase [Bowmanella yangjiangensis]